MLWCAIRTQIVDLILTPLTLMRRVQVMKTCAHVNQYYDSVEACSSASRQMMTRVIYTVIMSPCYLITIFFPFVFSHEAMRWCTIHSKRYIAQYGFHTPHCLVVYSSASRLKYSPITSGSATVK